MRRLLMISAHFPPDTSAGTHRVRLLAAHLGDAGWQPTVLTVDPQDVDGRLDERLEALVPRSIGVVRVRAWSPVAARRFGVGDVGLRAFSALSAAARRLLAAERFDAVYITTYPIYPAALGPWLKRRFGVPFVLDLQDPWVGNWGRTVGPADGHPDAKSRISRRIALTLESRIPGCADAITAVSRGTFEELAARHPSMRRPPFLELPIGVEPTDLEAARRDGVNRVFTSGDGSVHICSVGTLLPRGLRVLEALLAAFGRIRDTRPDLFARIRLHFVGTSNQTVADAPARVLPFAERLGVAGQVTEQPARVDYLDALAILDSADAILVLGSDEPHYTASRIYPALMTGRPVVAAYHRASTVIGALARAGVDSSLVVAFGDDGPGREHEEALAAALVAVASQPDRFTFHGNACARLGDNGAPALARRFGSFLDTVLPLVTRD